MKKITRRNFLKATAVTGALTLAGCGKAASSSSAVASVAEDGREMVGNLYTEGLPVVKDTETFKILFYRSVNDLSESQNEKEWVKTQAADTNINIEWDEISTNIDEKLNLVFAAGQDMPDVIITEPKETTITQNLSRLVPLTDEMLRKYAPNFVAQVEANVPNGLDEFRKADGNIYTLPLGPYAEKANAATSIPYIRKDWLEAVGMEMPKTTDDLYNVLKAFKEKDPSGTGNIIPATFCDAFWAAQIFVYAGPWGIAGRTANNLDNYYVVEDGVFKPMINSQNLRDFMEYMHKLAKDGLLDVEGFSMTAAQYKSRIQEGTVGLHHFWMQPIDKYDPLPVLTAPGYEGQEKKQGEKGYRTAIMDGFAITKSCRSPETILRWWDHLHSDPDLKRVVRDGPEGPLWTKNADGTATVAVPETLPDGIPDAITLNYTIGNRAYGPVMFGDDVPAPDMNAEVLTDDALRYMYNDMYEPFFQDELVPRRPVDAAKMTERVLLETEIESCVKSFVSTGIVNGVTDESWNEYLAKLDALQIDTWSKWYQDYLDKKF